MGRAPCCDKANVKKGPWSPEEDAKLKSYIEKHGTGGNWIALPQKIGLKRCGKSCRLRWLNYLRPNIKHGSFSEEEDRIICSLYVSIGSRWSIIAAQLPGRTDNDIKNYWNTRLKKKLFGKQRKDHHHHQQQRAARRGNALKQMQQMKRSLENNNSTQLGEVINNNNNSSMFSLNEAHNNTPYWPQHQLIVPPNYNTNMPLSDPINSIDNLSKFGAPFVEQSVYSNNANGYSHFLPGQSSSSQMAAELENYNMGFDDPRRVEFLYGDHPIPITAAADDQGCEMGSSNYEAMLQNLSTTTQDYYAKFDETLKNIMIQSGRHIK